MYDESYPEENAADTFLSLANEYVRARDEAASLGLKVSSLSEEHEKVTAKRDAIKRQLLEHLQPSSKALDVEAAMKDFRARGGVR